MNRDLNQIPYREEAKASLIDLINQFPERTIGQTIFSIVSVLGRENISKLYDIDDESFYALVEKTIEHELPDREYTENKEELETTKETPTNEQ